MSRRFANNREMEPIFRIAGRRNSLRLATILLTINAVLQAPAEGFSVIQSRF